MLIYHTFFIIITFPLDFHPGHIELQRIWLTTITTNAKESLCWKIMKDQDVHKEMMQ